MTTTHLAYYSVPRRAEQVERLRGLQAEAARHAQHRDHAHKEAGPFAHPGRTQAPTLGVHDKTQWPGDAYCWDFIFVSEDLAPRVQQVVVNAVTAASDHQPVLLRLRQQRAPEFDLGLLSPSHACRKVIRPFRPRSRHNGLNQKMFQEC